jgi:hypothetical protein
MLRRAVRRNAFARILGGRHMECAYYFVDGTWNVPTTLTCRRCPNCQLAALVKNVFQDSYRGSFRVTAIPGLAWGRIGVVSSFMEA